MTSTEITPTTGIAAPPGVATTIVNVLPYAYWPMNERWQYAKALAGAKELLPAGLRAGTLEDTAAKVFLVMETGAMLGLHPMAAFQGIDVIEGNATISPELGSALVRAAGHKLRKSESGTIRDGDFTVTWTLIRSDDPEPRTASWSLEDSVQAGLVQLIGQPGQYKVQARSSNDKPLNHEKYPKDMTQWRALGRLLRSDAADVTMGLGYFPEELQVALGDSSPTGSIHRDMTAEEDAIIAEFMNGTEYRYDDKADLARVWQQFHNRDAWNARVEAAFDAALSKTTKDTREQSKGVIEPPSSDPTDYDDAESDGAGGVRSETMEREQREYAAAVVGEPPSEPEPEPEPVTVPAGPPLSDEEQLRLDAERADAAAAAEYEREHPAKPAADMSALSGKIDPDDPRLV